ncbi:MAG: YabP/YqfC family sporulation protein, partial [Clostridia bacterium]|nr:YabP/YqfC family sporulation protein [Clostridia bacterium]
MTEEIRQPIKSAVKQPHNVIMEDRKSLTVTGVKDVDSFDE